MLPRFLDGLLGTRGFAKRAGAFRFPASRWRASNCPAPQSPASWPVSHFAVLCIGLKIDALHGEGRPSHLSTAPLQSCKHSACGPENGGRSHPLLASVVTDAGNTESAGGHLVPVGGEAVVQDPRLDRQPFRDPGRFADCRGVLGVWASPGLAAQVARPLDDEMVGGHLKRAFPGRGKRGVPEQDP
jgi:hypothetical protein